MKQKINKCANDAYLAQINFFEHWICRIFLLTKRNLLFCFHLKKNAAQNQRMLSEAYDDYIPSISTCKYCYKKGDFVMTLSGRQEMSRPAEKVWRWESGSFTRSESNARRSCRIIKCCQLTIFRHLKAIGMIQKQRNWVPYELKPKDVERRKMTCELLHQRHRRKSFLHRIVTDDEKWIR